VVGIQITRAPIASAAATAAGFRPPTCWLSAKAP